MNGYFKVITIGCALFATACQHYTDELSALDGQMKSTQVASSLSPQDIAPAAGGEQAATNLSPLLAREYYDMARYENDTAFDYKAAKLFTGKALLASKGQPTGPSRVGQYDISDDKIGELNDARKQLLAALQEQNVPGNQELLAKAQTRFDCWLDRAEEASDEKHYQSCKEEFEQSMAAMTMPAAGNSLNVTEINFAPASPAMEAISQQGLDKVAAFLATPQAQGYSAVVTAYTNPANVSDKDRQMASNRALSVRSELMKRGIADAAIKPQIAPLPQTPGIMPVSGGPATDIAALDNKVQIHLVAPTPAIIAPARPDIMAQ